ncbi:excisionase family protein [Enterobacter cloacae]|nr:excisionase family protein [Enterobacter cloacae]
MDSVHHIWCPLSSQEYQDLPDGAETTLTIIQLVPNKWVTEELLTATTGMSKHMIQHARRSTWMEGKHYRHVAPDMAPKQNSPIMYNRDEINHWIEHQSPAKRRRISA